MQVMSDSDYQKWLQDQKKPTTSASVAPSDQAIAVTSISDKGE